MAWEVISRIWLLSLRIWWHGAAMTEKIKNAAAVALGRLGGLKGGKARAMALTAKERSASASAAARARWNEKTKKKGAKN